MVLIFSVVIGLALDFAVARPADSAIKYYASKYDHIDVETILNNRRMVNYYSACLLSRGPCPPEGTEFKRILPEALQTNCARCTEKQATVALRAIKRLRKEYPKIWNQLAEKWDPDEEGVKKFESTFGLRTSTINPPSEQPAILSRFGGDDDGDSTDNNIDGSFSVASTPSQDSTSRGVLTTSNSSPPSSTISTTTKTTTDYPYPSYESTSLVSTTKITTKPSLASTPNTSSSFSTTITSTFSTTTRPSTSTTSPTKTSTRPPVIPGLIPINTFFTNPPIPIRPLINLNLGANIEATVSGLVRGLGALGTRVMEAGADIAEVVIKNFSRPLRI